MAEKNNNSGKEIVLKVLMHCEGCQNKVSKCLRSFEGVEEVVVDYPNHKVTVKGKSAEPQTVLERVQNKFSRNAELISPIPKPENKQKKEPETKEAAPPPVKVVVLKTLMHCEGCAIDIPKYLEKIQGVLSVEANMESSRVRVRGIVEAAKLVEYIKKELGKHADIVKQEQGEERGQGKGIQLSARKEEENVYSSIHLSIQLSTFTLVKHLVMKTLLPVPQCKKSLVKFKTATLSSFQFRFVHEQSDFR